MIIDIENTSESTLIIEYRNKTYEFRGNTIGQLETDSLEFEFSAYMITPEQFDSELEPKSIKDRIMQKGFDKLYNLFKKMIIQCKNTYSVKLNSSAAKLVFNYEVFGKERSNADDFFDMPLEVLSFARLECDNADKKIINCSVINKKEFFKMYRNIYFWINWNLGLLALLLYLPPYFKQRKMVSKKRLMDFFADLYSVSKTERDSLLVTESDSNNAEADNTAYEMDSSNNGVSKNKGCFKTFVRIGLFVLIMAVLLIIGIVWMAKHIALT